MNLQNEKNKSALLAGEKASLESKVAELQEELKMAQQESQVYQEELENEQKKSTALANEIEESADFYSIKARVETMEEHFAGKSASWDVTKERAEFMSMFPDAAKAMKNPSPMDDIVKVAQEVAQVEASEKASLKAPEA